MTTQSERVQVRCSSLVGSDLLQGGRGSGVGWGGVCGVVVVVVVVVWTWNLTHVSVDTRQ